MPGAPVNGYHVARQFLTGIDGESPPRPQGKPAAVLETTRYLAAATQVDTKYAANVAGRVFGEPLRALAPGYGTDTPVVAMWALKALRTRQERDLALVAALILQAFFITLAIIVSPWLLIALPPLLAMAWAAVAWEYWERIHHCIVGQMLRDRFDPAKAPSPRRPGERERLRELAQRKDGNLVVFSGPSAFVGTGDIAYSERMLFDIGAAPGQRSETHGRKGGNFTSHDIHLAIIDAFSSARGLGRSLENIEVRERLFVDGRHVQDDTRLLPDPLRPPCTTVGDDLLAAAAACPSRDSRSYVCVEIPGWQGQLVVTLFARAVYTGRSLFVEWTFRVLPPLRDAFLGIDSRFEYPLYQQVLNSLAASAGATVPALACSPVTALRPVLRPYAARIRHSRLKYAIEHGYVFDYGARRSIREDASSRKSTGSFLARDETMYMLLAQQTLLQAVRGFLSERGVDLETFNKQAQVIFDNSIHIGDISDSSAIAVGTDSAASLRTIREGNDEQRSSQSQHQGRESHADCRGRYRTGCPGIGSAAAGGRRRPYRGDAGCARQPDRRARRRTQ